MPDTPAAELRQRFLDGMSFAAATVNIVTTDGAAGRHGVTVSAMSSVSADSAAPSLLVCVHHLSQACAAIEANGVFCVNVLRDDQAAISDVFAGRRKPPSGGSKFDSARWTVQATGAPRIIDPLVAFDCRLKHTLRYGTHHIFIGEVADIFAQDRGNPLIYANRGYGTPARLATAPAAAASGSGERLRVGSLVTLAPFVVPQILARLAARMPELGVDLIERPHTELLQRLASGDCDLALTYGFDLDAGVETLPLASVPVYVLLARDHPLASAARVALADLAREPMILLDLPMSRDYFLGLFTARGLEPRIRLRSTNFETVRGLVGHGLGFALLGTKPANNMTYDGQGLVTRPLADRCADSTIVLAVRRGALLSQAAEAFRAVCRELFHA